MSDLPLLVRFGATDTLAFRIIRIRVHLTPDHRHPADVMRARPGGMHDALSHSARKKNAGDVSRMAGACRISANQ
jgi:hypothetical protein